MALYIGGVAVDATAAEIDVLDGLDRGSIIYGNASSATTVLGQGNADEVLTSDGTDIAWAAGSSGAITALNNATANELVTVGSTTTELDAESTLTYDGTTFGVDDAAVFNESGNDNDFRVEGSGAANALFVQGSDGNVGIGTASPTETLDVRSGVQTIAEFNSGVASGHIVIGVDSSAINNNSGISFCLPTIGDVIGSGRNMAHISATCSQVSPSLRGYLTFHTNSGDQTVERMRLDEDGNVLLNGSSADMTGSGTCFTYPSVVETMPTYLHFKKTYVGIRDAISFNHDGSRVGSVQFGDSTTSFNTSSDYRLKENEVSISDGLERLNQLKPYRFNFKSDADNTVDGFFAHEVSGIVPEAISGDKDAMRTEEYEVEPAVLDDDENIVTEAVMGEREVIDPQGIDQSKLVPLLVKAVQELSAKVEALENA